MRKNRLSGLVLAVALAAAPITASASAAIIAATSAATMAAMNSSTSSTGPAPMAQGVSAEPIEWASVGWLYCSTRFAEPNGCREKIEHTFSVEAGEVEPWVEWMKRHKGPRARFMGLTVEPNGTARLFYGVPVEESGE
ncbi:MAG: hypothetical protein VX796_09280 [Pseudomonadota bacterium]|nr:hypothetical protein [Pseudomonadota bacterium]